MGFFVGFVGFVVAVVFNGRKQDGHGVGFSWAQDLLGFMSYSAVS